MLRIDTVYHHQALEELDRVPQEYLPDVVEMLRIFRESVSSSSAQATSRQDRGGPGRSVLAIPPHDSGEMRRGWTRSELYDEMLER